MKTLSVCLFYFSGFLSTVLLPVFVWYGLPFDSHLDHQIPSSFVVFSPLVKFPVWATTKFFEADKRARRHAQTTTITTTATATSLTILPTLPLPLPLPPSPVTRSPTPSRLTPTPSITVHEHEPSRPASRAGLSDGSSVPVSPAYSALHLPTPSLQPSPTATRRISSGCTLLAAAAAAGTTAAGQPVLTSMLSSVDIRPPSPDEMQGDAHSGKEREAVSCAATAAASTKKRKMPIINPLVTLPMWPSKSRVRLSTPFFFTFLFSTCWAGFYSSSIVSIFLMGYPTPFVFKVPS